MNWIEETGFKIGLFLAGLVGAATSLLKPHKLSIYQRVFTILAGGGAAIYLTPVFIAPVENFHEIGHSGELASAYLIGYSGLKSIELAIVQVKKFFKKR